MTIGSKRADLEHLLGFAAQSRYDACGVSGSMETGARDDRPSDAESDPVGERAPHHAGAISPDDRPDPLSQPIGTADQLAPPSVVMSSWLATLVGGPGTPWITTP